jgi:hypothetical protein
MPDTPKDPVVEGVGGAATGSGSDGTPLSSLRNSSSSGTESDWTVVVTERIEGIVGTLRDRTTVPITKIVRAVVFGLIITVMGTVALVFGVIGVLRLHVYLPLHPDGRRVWVTYVGLGAIFMLAGAFCWRKRTIRTKE